MAAFQVEAAGGLYDLMWTQRPDQIDWSKAPPRPSQLVNHFPRAEDITTKVTHGPLPFCGTSTFIHI